MLQLNLPPFEYQLRKEANRLQIFDIIRRKFLVLTPEEWVRQHFIHFLINQYQYPKSLIQVETGLKYNALQKRTDIVVYDREGKPFLVIECKAPNVKISEETFRQASAYNKILQAPYLAITNGMVHQCCKTDWESGEISFLKEIPVF